MPIVTARFPDDLLEELEAVVEEGEYRDRTHALRVATRRLCREPELREADRPDGATV